MFYNKMVALHTKSAEKLILELDRAVKEDVMWGLDEDKLKKWSQKKQQ